MSFERTDGVLHAEQVSLLSLAQQHGTPLYVYSRAALERHYTAFDQAFDFIEHQVCFAVKANSNIGVLNVLARMGAAVESTI